MLFWTPGSKVPVGEAVRYSKSRTLRLAWGPLWWRNQISPIDAGGTSFSVQRSKHKYFPSATLCARTSKRRNVANSDTSHMSATSVVWQRFLGRGTLYFWSHHGALMWEKQSAASYDSYESWWLPEVMIHDWYRKLQNRRNYIEGWIGAAAIRRWHSMGRNIVLDTMLWSYKVVSRPAQFSRVWESEFMNDSLLFGLLLKQILLEKFLSPRTLFSEIDSRCVPSLDVYKPFVNLETQCVAELNQWPPCFLLFNSCYL